jgi:hypothetical protein
VRRETEGTISLTFVVEMGVFLHFKEACDSVMRQVLCNILEEFGVPMK